MAKAKKRGETAITHVNPDLPVHMQDVPEGEYGLDQVGQFIVPPRLKVVHGMSDEEVRKVFGVGDVIIVPTMQLVAPMKRHARSGQPVSSPGFLFTPLFFWVEYCTWDDITQRGKGPAVMERSLEPSSDIAVKARSPNRRFEKIDENRTIRHVEHLNFLVQVEDDELPPAIMSFERGDHTAGAKFCGLLQSRKAPIYGCVFQANLSERKNDKGQWWGLDIANPDDGPWVDDAEQFATFKGLNAGFRKAHADKLLRPDYEGEPTPVTVGSEGEDGKPEAY